MRYLKNPAKPFSFLLVLHFLSCAWTWGSSPETPYRVVNCWSIKPLRFCFIYVNTDCVFLSLLPTEQYLSRAAVASGKRRQPFFQWMQFILAHKFYMLWGFIDLPSSPPHIFPSFFFNTQIQMMYKWSRSWLGKCREHWHLHVFHCKLHI